MTYAKTANLIKVIDQLETFAICLNRELKRDVIDYAQVERYEKWVAEAKQDIFDIASK
jgi:hypothetical protein